VPTSLSVPDVGSIFDQTTDSCLFHPEIEERLAREETLGLVLINIDGLETISKTLGSETYEKILKEFTLHVRHLQGNTIRKMDHLVLSAPVGNDFPVLLTAGRSGERIKHLARSDVDGVAKRIRNRLCESLCEIVKHHCRGSAKLSVVFKKHVHKGHSTNKRIIQLNVSVEEPHNEGAS
jgi:GGDEF domain-containing protein